MSSTVQTLQKSEIKTLGPLAIVLAAALTGYLLFLFAPAVLNDGDTYWHVAAGEWIIQHRAVPFTDPFSYTFAGRPWVAHEWLSELAMGIAYRLGGWSGLVVMFGGVMALTLALMARHLTRWLDPVPALLALMVGGFCIAPSLLARPHIFALPLLELWTAGLLIARQKGNVPWRLLPLMTLWANLHASFLFGIALIVPFLLEAVLAAGAAWRRVARPWVLFLICATVMALITPHGLHGLTFPVRLMSMKTLGEITEWQSPDFQRITPTEVALMVGIYACLSRGVRLPLLRLFILMGLLHLSLQHARHQMVLGVAGTLIFAESLRSAPPAAALADWARTWPRRIAAAAVIIVGVSTAMRFVYPLTRTDSHVSPDTAFAHVPAQLAAAPVLNAYEFGGFLIFHGVRPFIDGRADMYGDAFLEDYQKIMRSDSARLEQTLKAREIQWTILAPDSPAATVMDNLPGWRRLYGDKFAVIHARIGAP